MNALHLEMRQSLQRRSKSAVLRLMYLPLADCLTRHTHLLTHSLYILWHTPSWLAYLRCLTARCTVHDNDVPTSVLDTAGCK